MNPDFASGSNLKRDVFLQGDCDQGCIELTRLLGWEEELYNLIYEGNYKIDLRNYYPDNYLPEQPDFSEYYLYVE